MRKFIFSAAITVSAHTIVEAETPEEALEIAESRGAALYFNGSGERPEEVWCVEEADGEPTDITHLEDMDEDIEDEEEVET